MGVRWVSIAAPVLVGCTFGSMGGAGSGATLGGESNDATDVDASATVGDEASGETHTGAHTDSVGASADTGADDSITGGCVAGSEGCPCDVRVCDEGLTCIGDVCVADSCGNGQREGDELCDDGNRTLGDGCDACVPSRGARSLVAGSEHTCALTWDGAVRCWGSSAGGQLGYGNKAPIGDDEEPWVAGDVPVGGPVVALSAGADFTCALLEGGAVRCWGEGDAGRLGAGHELDIGDDEPASDAPTVALGGTALQISSGNMHTCAVLEGGDLVCWGEGAQGRLGHGNQDDIGDNELPTAVGPVDVGAAVVAVAAGNQHTCARLDTGGVKCWGNGNAGRLGYGDNVTIGESGGETPASVGEVQIGAQVEHLALGGAHTCVILVGGAVRCWGANAGGRLGYGHDDDLGDGPDELPSMLGDVDVGGVAIGLGLGGQHTCAILEDGTVKCWGEADDGRLGYENIDDALSPPGMPVAVSPDQRVLRIEGGAEHTCARLDLGNVRCWGLGTLGRLGRGNVDSIGDDPGETPEGVGDVPFLDP